MQFVNLYLYHNLIKVFEKSLWREKYGYINSKTRTFKAG